MMKIKEQYKEYVKDNNLFYYTPYVPMQYYSDWNDADSYGRITVGLKTRYD